MCGRYQGRYIKQRLAEEFHLRNLQEMTTELAPNFNIAPSTMQPVILEPKDYTRWLTRADDEQPPIDLLRPYDADGMRAWKVDPRVGNVRNNEPGLCSEWDCPPNSA